MSNINVDVEPFDNEISLLLKYSKLLNTPIKFLTVFEDPDKKLELSKNKLKNMDVVPLNLVIKELVDKKKSLTSIYDYFRDYLSSDIAMVYYSIFRNRSEIQVKIILQEINNLFEDTNCCQKFSDLSDLEDVYSVWIQIYSNNLQNDLKKLKKLEELQNELKELDPLPVSEFKIREFDLNATIKNKNGKRITIDDGIDVFDDSKVTEKIPFLGYISEDSSFFRLYQSDKKINYEQFIPFDSDMTKKDRAHFTFWDGRGSLDNSRNESFLSGTIFFDSKKLTIKKINSDIIKEEEIINTIEKEIPISIGNFDRSKISGEFIILDVNSEEYKNRVPKWLRKLTLPTTLVLYPLIVNKRCLGLIYADNDDSSIKISMEALGFFKTLRNQASLAIQQRKK